MTKNFTLAELTVTNSGLPNVPNEEQIKNLERLANDILQPLRDKFGKPIKVTSGFRSIEVNKHIGGSSTSQHCKGQACDMVCEDNAHLFGIIRKNFKFTQLIWEGGTSLQPAWVHVGYDPNNLKCEVLRMKNGKYTKM
jgi:hypothetical protein